MTTIIAGGRNVTDYQLLLYAISESNIEITKVISGGARGVDYMGEWYAEDNGIPLEIEKANWDKFGKKAGSIRNAAMANKAEALIALWDGVSPGTGNMIDTARAKGLTVYVELTNEQL